MDKPLKLRIKSFHYNTTIRGTTSTAGLKEHASDLIRKLYNDREDDMSATLRPIIFVGHSLGGMLIKRVSRSIPNIPIWTHPPLLTVIKALRIAVGNGDEAVEYRYRSLWQASRGIVSLSLGYPIPTILTHQMFFSTPHFGLANTSDVWAKFAKHVLQHNPPLHVQGATPTQNMLDEIGLNSLELYKITEDFKPIQDELDFVTFVESEAMDGLEEHEVVSILPARSTTLNPTLLCLGTR